MRVISCRTWLCAGILLALPWAAHAIGLGRLTVQSVFGAPLRAEIELVAATEEELGSLTARIAAPEAFKQAKIRYSPVLIGARLSIVRRPDGRSIIRIGSAHPVDELFIDLLVELIWPQGHLIRQYAALLDPPERTGAPAAQPASPVQPPLAVWLGSSMLAGATPPAEVKPEAKAPPVPLQEAALPRAAGKEYGPVRAGETLSQIAASIKPKGVTLNEMLASLYRANPNAFGNNMNVLKAGAMLRIPDEHQEARASKPETVKDARAPVASKEAPAEVLRLSGGHVTNTGKAGDRKDVPRRFAEIARALEAEMAARDKALTEANARVAQLEQTVMSLRRQIGLPERVPGAAPPGPISQAAPEARPGIAAPDAAKAAPPRMEFAREAGEMIADAPGGSEQSAPAAQPAAAGPPPPEAEAPASDSGLKAKPARVAQPPQNEMHQFLVEPLYLAGGGLLALLGGAGYWSVRRRRARAANLGARVAAAAARAASVAAAVANAKASAAVTAKAGATFDTPRG